MEDYERHQKARELMEQGQFVEAASLLEQNIKSNPHFKDLELLGECLFHLNRLSEAVLPLAAATTLNKGVKAPSLLAEVFFLQDNLSDARNAVEIALSRDPQNHKALGIKEQLDTVSQDHEEWQAWPWHPSGK